MRPRLGRGGARSDRIPPICRILGRLSRYEGARSRLEFGTRVRNPKEFSYASFGGVGNIFGSAKHTEL